MRNDTDRKRKTSRSRRFAVCSGILLVLMSILTITPTATSFHKDSLPVVATLVGDEGTSWAIAIQSDSTIHTPQGNPLSVDAWTMGPRTSSVDSVGIVRLDASDPVNKYSIGLVVSGFAPDNRIAAHPLGTVEDPVPSFSLLSSDEDDRLTGLGYNAGSTDPEFWGGLKANEWHYLLIWAAGGTTSEITIRGIGIEVMGIYEGSAHSMGAAELLEESVFVYQGLEPTSGDANSLGVGAAVAAGERYSLDAEENLHGIWFTSDVVGACANLNQALPIPPNCVFQVGTTTDLQGACTAYLWHILPSGVRDCGMNAKISWSGPHFGESGHSGYFLPFGNANPPGTYHFDIDRFVGLGGPVYFDPLTKSGPYSAGSVLVLSLGEVDLSPLGEWEQ